MTDPDLRRSDEEGLSASSAEAAQGPGQQASWGAQPPIREAWEPPPDETDVANRPDPIAALAWRPTEESTLPTGPASPPPSPPGGAGSEVRRRTPAMVTALALALVVLALALLGCAGLVFKLSTDRSAAQSALLAAVGAISASVDPDLSTAVGPNLARIREAVDQGHFVEAASRLQHLAESGSPRGSGDDWTPPFPTLPGAESGAPGDMERQGPEAATGVPASSEAASELPPETLQFFRQNTKLAELFGRANMAGRELKERGGDVRKLRELRGLIIEAARLHNKQRVVELLKEFEREFTDQARKLAAASEPATAAHQGPRGHRRRLGGMMAPPPRELPLMVRRVNQALQQARLEGRDLSQVGPLLRLADQAAGSRQFDRALSLTRLALAAIQQAPKLPPTPAFFRNPLVEMFLALLQREDRELGGIVRHLETTYRSADNSTLAKLAAGIKQALDALRNVGAQRRAFGRRLQEIRTGRAHPITPEQAEAAVRERAQRARAAIAAILARTQAMTPQQFTASRDNLVDEILAAVFSQSQRIPARAAVGETGEDAAGPPGPERGEKAQPAAAVRPDPGQVVRDKLLAAAEPFIKVKNDPSQKELALQVGILFARARALLTAGKYAEADRLVDEGMALLENQVEAETGGTVAPELPPRGAADAPGNPANAQD